MKNKKLGTLIASLALVAALGVGATLAYFTDSDTALNTITMGNVDIDLEEPEFDPDGDGEGEIDDVKPGQEIVKDPTITVKANSADAYLRAKITYEGLSDTQAEELEELITFQDGWVKSEDGYYYFQYVVSEFSEDQKIVFFNMVTIPSSWGNEMAEKTFKIDVQAEAIQADNFTPETDNNGVINGWNDVTVETYNPSGSQE